MPAFSLLRAPRELAAAASLHEERSPTTPSEDEVHSFGGRLEPRYIIRARALDQ